MLSVIIPTFNEVKNNYLSKILQGYDRLSSQLSPGRLEVVCVDKNSSDGTQKLIESSSAKLVLSSSNSRAARINEGILASKGQMILINHPRSTIEPEGISFLIDNLANLTWGGFTHKFDQDGRFYDFTSWYSNHVRLRFQHIIYLDHCIFARSSYFQDDPCPIPDVDIFEDSEICRKLYRLAGKPSLLPYASTTSSLRFEHNGKFRQGMLNQWMKLAYRLKLPHNWMNKVYEKGLSLNSSYTGKRPAEKTSREDRPEKENV